MRARTNTARTVRIDTPINESALRKFALAVSQALTRIQDNVDAGAVVPAEAVSGTVGSWAVSLYNEQTGTLAFLPGVRFVPVGANDVNIGFEIDVSPTTGTGIGGTAQGYMFNYGTVNGAKLAAGMSANNEDPNEPRVDLGFKPKKGATMEFYGVDGDSTNYRKGQLRATLGPAGQLAIFKYVSGDTWECIGGFGPNGEMVCGWKNTDWPGGHDTWGATTAPPAVLNVYAQTGGVGAESSYTKKPIATVSAAGVELLKKLQLYTGADATAPGNSVTLDPTGASASVTLTLQQKKLKDASDVETLCWVLCAAV